MKKKFKYWNLSFNYNDFICLEIFSSVIDIGWVGDVLFCVLILSFSLLLIYLFLIFGFHGTLTHMSNSGTFLDLLNHVTFILKFIHVVKIFLYLRKRGYFNLSLSSLLLFYNFSIVYTTPIRQSLKWVLFR